MNKKITFFLISAGLLIVFAMISDQFENLQAQIDSLKQVSVSSSGLEKPSDISSIVKRWSPQVALVYCEWNYGGHIVSATGSGFLTEDINGVIYILTNKHVLFDEDKYAPVYCTTRFLNGKAYRTDYSPDDIVMNDIYDIGQMKVNASEKDIHISDFCQTSADIGDSVVVLGYPGIGSNRGITATEGIISGIEKDFYITSAKIDHGNSGGIAVSVKDDCIIGMPSSAITGSIESLGRILKTSVILK